MVFVKRLAIWLLETTCEAVLLGLFLVLAYGPDRRGFAGDLWLVTAGIALFSFTTGYLLTTAIARVVSAVGRRLWLYSAVAAGLFMIHVQILFSVASGWSSAERIRVRLAGLCIVLGCTLCGSYILRKWVRPSDDPGAGRRSPAVSAS
jgi:hypothetical protein